jgi:hypothetical protein
MERILVMFVLMEPFIAWVRDRIQPKEKRKVVRGGVRTKIRGQVM